ncbi:MAG: ribosome biogenesis factor YjgA [Gammaproteobacteria bacterium]|nr:ribosome biogenesis factor YjgA [Gammaproteobacteria bacterium]
MRTIDPQLNKPFVEELEPSRSQLKRDAQFLLKAGKEIVALNDNDLKKIPMSDSLEHAVGVARKINSYGGIKRQFQFIAKLLRNCDVEPILSELEKIKNRGLQENQRFKQLETWRDKLLSGDNQAQQDYLERHPQADRQKLRQLVRNACKEIELDKTPKSSRSLFRYLREIDEAQ